MNATPIVLVLLGPTGSGKTQAIQELGLDPKKYVYIFFKAINKMKYIIDSNKK